MSEQQQYLPTREVPVEMPAESKDAGEREVGRFAGMSSTMDPMSGR